MILLVRKVTLDVKTLEKKKGKQTISDYPAIMSSCLTNVINPNFHCLHKLSTIIDKRVFLTWLFTILYG